ncbi:NnrU family protein [Cupriavidus metallidurans]|uniref:NnrU family protein n=1 Tax=Cupriavidus metallidurans TaxID=119219 RepID=UPI001CD006ED|nr:NnrU family protein [Cupriavidus metallidurans]UBM08074.1 NnrU family protein [Cupriavidus metallidurans]
MGSIGAVVVASVAFVGSHFLLSHPLRGALVRAVGEKGFLGIDSLVAFLTLGWMVMTYKRAPVSSPLWVPGDGIWAVVTVVMLIASILLMGSLIRNPALPTVGRPGAFPEAARGVFAVTRHPMMWAFALWGVCHIAVYPVTRNIVVALAMIVLALVGAALQDQKKERLLPDRWPDWEAKTSYLPFAAIVTGRARLAGFGSHALLGGLIVWLAATWAHLPLAGVAAGIWRWL